MARAFGRTQMVVVSTEKTKGHPFRAIIYPEASGRTSDEIIGIDDLDFLEHWKSSIVKHGHHTTIKYVTPHGDNMSVIEFTNDDGIVTLFDEEAWYTYQNLTLKSASGGRLRRKILRRRR